MMDKFEKILAGIMITTCVVCTLALITVIVLYGCEIGGVV